MQEEKEVIVKEKENEKRSKESNNEKRESNKGKVIEEAEQQVWLAYKLCCVKLLIQTFILYIYALDS